MELSYHKKITNGNKIDIQINVLTYEEICHKINMHSMVEDGAQ